MARATVSVAAHPHLLRLQRVVAHHPAITGCLFLCVMAFVTHFLRFQSFGLYEDDYYFITTPMQWSPQALLEHVRFAWTAWPQGRPIGFSLPQILTFIGLQRGGLPAVYVIAFAILALNCCLFYGLLLRVSTPSFALVGAMAFCVFPADTTRPFLTHAFQLQTSLTFCLLAGLAYSSRWRPLSYFIAVGALLTYESGYLPFLAIPLLAKPWSRRFAMRYVIHVALCAATIALVLVLRAATGEPRAAAAGSNWLETLGKVALGTVIGPTVSMGLFAFRPLYTLAQLNVWALLLATLAALCVWLVLMLLDARWESANESPPTHTVAEWEWHMLIAGMVMLCTGYLASFTHFPPIRPFGRLTSVHLGATMGASIVFAWAWMHGLPMIVTRYRPRLIPVIRPALAVTVGLLVGHGLLIQNDYATSWRDQRRFWADVARLAPDMQQGTLILVPKSQLPRTQYIHTHSWANAIVLEQLFAFPQDWSSPPRVFLLEDDWLDHVTWEGDQARWLMPSGMWDEQMSPLPPANVILLEGLDGQLTRRSGEIQLHGRAFQLKPFDVGTISTLAPGPLLPHMSLNHGAENTRISPQAAQNKNPCLLPKLA
jgi:hypothetical protein